MSLFSRFALSPRYIATFTRSRRRDNDNKNVEVCLMFATLIHYVSSKLSITVATWTTPRNEFQEKKRAVAAAVIIAFVVVMYECCTY